MDYFPVLCMSKQEIFSKKYGIDLGPQNSFKQELLLKKACLCAEERKKNTDMDWTNN